MLLKLDCGFNYSQKYFLNVIYTCLLEYNPSFSESPLSCIYATNLNQTQLALNLYHMIRTSWKSTPIPLNDRRKFGVRFTSRLQNHMMPISFIKPATRMLTIKPKMNILPITNIKTQKLLGSISQF
jgi:hypothetical protein